MAARKSEAHRSSTSLIFRLKSLDSPMWSRSQCRFWLRMRWATYRPWSWWAEGCSPDCIGLPIAGNSLRWLRRKKRLPGQAMERVPIMSSIRFPKLTFWRIVVAIIFLAGAYAAYARFALGFERSTNLADSQPWGLWVGLGTLCGVGISAGGFALAAAVYLLGFERYRPVVRAAVLLSFLGYLSVVVGMMYELGLPWRIWHPIVMWNRRSVLFEVSWCVMLYTTVLSLEFSPSLVEKIPWVRLRDWYLKWHHHVLVALVLIGAILSSLHQSFLGGLYLLAKGKVDPLWYSPYLPTLFYLSAVPAGLSATIMD